MTWQLAEANNRFGELVTKALTEGPQRVRRGDEVIIVISEADYQRLTGERPTFRDWILNGPDLSDLDLTRDQSLMREVEW